MKNRYRLLFLTAVMGGVYLSLKYINPYGDAITLSELVLQLSGSRGSFALGFSLLELEAFGMCLFPAFIFEVYAGIMLYRHFCTASIYIFSRCPHRMKWYMREVCHLCAAVSVFHILLLAAAVLTVVIRYTILPDSAGIALLVYHFLIQSLWVYIMALLVNLFAVFWGSSTSYAIVVGAQLICIVLLNLMDRLVRASDGRLSYENILIWNPVSHLVVGWHSSNAESVRQVLTSSYMQADLYHSLIMLLAAGIIITFAGAFVIKKHDLLISDLETGVA